MSFEGRVVWGERIVGWFEWRGSYRSVVFLLFREFILELIKFMRGFSRYL